MLTSKQKSGVRGVCKFNDSASRSDTFWQLRVLRRLAFAVGGLFLRRCCRLMVVLADVANACWQMRVLTELAPSGRWVHMRVFLTAL